jgi:hypothetical protein
MATPSNTFSESLNHPYLPVKKARNWHDEPLKERHLVTT